MKWFSFIILFLLISCKPYSLYNDRTPRFKDSDEGKISFDIPDIEEIGLDEIRKDKESCKNYDNHTSRSLVLGEKSPFNPIVNCIAYNIDKGIKPLCDLEKDVRSELDKTRDDYKARELEYYLDEIEAEKELFIDYIYALADPIYDTCADIEEDFADYTDKIKDDNKFLFGTVVDFAVDVTINSECRRVYRVMDSKAGLACIDLDFRSFKN